MQFAIFVPVAGNWRVFIRLMDMKRKGEGGGCRGEEGSGRTRDGRAGGPLDFTKTNPAQWSNKFCCVE